MAPSSPRPYIGGQAVLEGVMMRAPSSFAVVVRRRDGSLLIRERAIVDARARRVVRWPLVRGLASLVESLRLGSEALRFSAEEFEKSTGVDGDPARASQGPGLGVLGAFGMTLFSLVTRADGVDPVTAQQGAEESAGGRSWVMLVVAIGFFIALPQAVAAAVNRMLHLGLEVQSAPFQAITGALKLAVVIGYLVAIRRVPEIRRVFQYHGAEHKTITTYEAGESLVVENARPKTTLHPRCGTTFLVMVAIVSIAVFVAVGAALPRIHTGSAVADNLVFFLEKLPFLPLLVAVTFELQRLFSRYCATGPLRALLAPGFLVQRITTAEPDDEQLEVALASLRVTLFRQEQTREQGEQDTASGDVTFATYNALLAAPRLRAETANERAA